MARLHLSRAPIRGIKGPLRSGKSWGISHELGLKAMEQEPNPNDGMRRTRWAIIRNTYRELEDTTLATWLTVWPEDIFGKFNHRSMTHKMRFNDVEADFLFRALDKPGDIGKLLSLELTGGWINEAREIPKAVVDMLYDRCGQFPSKIDGGCSWHGVLMDTNPPDTDHWWYRLAEEERPPTWDFFSQPGALTPVEDTFLPNPKAENVENLNEGIDYYLSRMHGKSRDYIMVYYCAQYGFVQEGKPIWPEYVDDLHCSKLILKPVKGIKIYVGLDFGLTPAAIFGQRMPNGRWIIFDEMCADDMGCTKFSKLLAPMLRGEYRDFEVEIYGDPAGDKRSEVDEHTPFQILNANKIPAKRAPTNDFMVRRDAVGNALSQIVDGKPRLMISPKCKNLRKGMAGAYAYKRIQVSGAERYHDKPDKNQYSHSCDALQYLVLGAGEGDTVIKGAMKISKTALPKRKGKYAQGSAWMMG
jgi:hypothetical protein